MKPRKWISIPACPELKGKTFSADVSTYFLRLVRHYEQEERESDRAFHWNDVLPNLGNASWHEILGQRLASAHLQRKQQDEVRFFQNSKHFILYPRAIQGHTGGHMVIQELTGPVENSVQLERICLSQRMLCQHQIHL